MVRLPSGLATVHDFDSTYYLFKFFLSYKMSFELFYKVIVCFLMHMRHDVGDPETNFFNAEVCDKMDADESVLDAKIDTVVKNKKRKPNKAARMRRAWARRDRRLAKRLIYELMLQPISCSTTPSTSLQKHEAKMKHPKGAPHNQQHSPMPVAVTPRFATPSCAHEPTLLDMKSIKKRYLIFRKASHVAPEHNINKKRKKNSKPVLVLRDKRLLRIATFVSVVVTHGDRLYALMCLD